ncbi:hypothetical protein HK096_004203, partial [Nowakowskiella sp. JEL0078]
MADIDEEYYEIYDDEDQDDVSIEMDDIQDLGGKSNCKTEYSNKEDDENTIF